MDETLQMFQDVWALAYRRAERPVAGVLLPREVATRVLEDVFLGIFRDFAELPSRTEVSAEALGRARRAALATVAESRRRNGDPDLYRDPAENHYPHNLDLEKLRERSPDGTFQNREWDRLPPLLQPLGLALLGRKGLSNEDAEDVFVETMALLVRGRASDGLAPVEQVTVFEELIPVFCTMLGHRAIDWARAAKAERNRPNMGLSFEAITEDPDRPVQIADPTTVGKDVVGGLNFEEIYFQCRESLTPLEWHLLYEIYVSRSATRSDLIDDPATVEAIGSSMAESPATRRRRLNDHLVQALENLARGLDA
jgi:hypothetical protein